ncbi:MAG TPA: 5'-3' exonuclease H3TH domain-containing protein [Egicoccus sp.]|nr:5'-3' exonuclease H3TH domain-containing protein [Egicoccus sp.]HSK24849.1 5'-3' exonuclease H3TH domain-containing protein [Egicoccus sp.]
MRLHLVDGTYELFRSHFSKRPDRTDVHGRDVKATVGVVTALLSLLEDTDEQVTHLAVAFDNPIESWRNVRFPAYKDSSGVDPALLAQFDGVEAAVRALGVTVWSMREQEADDALGAAALRFAGEVDQVRILTPDKDLGQVVRGRRIVQVDRLRDKFYDEDGVRDRLGVPPASVPDLLALVGDTADGIPGLKGFGKVGAAAVLTRYGHLEDIPPDGADWDVEVRGAARLAQTLVEHRDDALLYRELATLITDLDLPGTLDDLAWRGADRDVWRRWCDEVASESLRERPTAWS